MTVRLRLQRLGKPNRPYYRIVAIDRRKQRDGKPLEILGHYDPIVGKTSVVVKTDRVEYWVKQGAELSRTVSSLLKTNKAAV
ncbi:MAG TPA: 30S ribosomal protein S16 [Elusimicrobia bacterium]|nr:MAG: 30S ribosomal protein S16 [Elusimicrobia bacterium RIFOXYA12_FULL_49_49]OGS10346.1 MAG: 30S ribosomal protein S16 [Elusimicrobia bacterium RIFOXYB1_FULL_48_9]OGS16636.1 MAG: 30S ribosomal protein S16 [Elusimicrobia bacterium RIFOXYA2_FULL_47_53]OGS25485.1 MAG: 30S ribosomal protein S16 [Elusimicrobia bacterium RIFOXYB12_FULL_50_12]OGS31614.1 MAG: 30S ribosomal protein S16 [Elusimicrobia bacterium RIFOXYB2_FULL_46_23]HBU69061.1 30S ribosomal protein S16 [Elusimicrobiota bacterium]